MFTGIISDIAGVRVAEQSDAGLKLTFDRPQSWTDLELGESVATDGVCLTVAELRDAEYDCFLMPETLAKTSFGQKVPNRVSLERALKVGDRLSGHFVQGHIDGVGTVQDIDTADGYRMSIQFDAKNRKLVVGKGSITINGISLTVANTVGDTLQVAIIPHTLEQTTLGEVQAGDAVNLEFDVLGKYVHNMKGGSDHATGATS